MGSVVHILEHDTCGAFSPHLSVALYKQPKRAVDLKPYSLRTAPRSTFTLPLPHVQPLCLNRLMALSGNHITEYEVLLV